MLQLYDRNGSKIFGMHFLFEENRWMRTKLWMHKSMNMRNIKQYYAWSILKNKYVCIYSLNFDRKKIYMYIYQRKELRYSPRRYLESRIPENSTARWFPSHLLLTLLLHFLFIFYLPRCTLPDFPLVSFLPLLFCCLQTTTYVPSKGCNSLKAYFPCIFKGQNSWDLRCNKIRIFCYI